MKPRVVVTNNGRLMVKKPPPTAWKPVELPRCKCGAIAAWQHPALGYRCNTCPRPERVPDPPKVAEVRDADVPSPDTLPVRDAALLKLRSAMRGRGELGPASGPEAQLEELASQVKPALEVYGQLKKEGLAGGWPQKLTQAGLEAASEVTSARSAR